MEKCLKVLIVFSFLSLGACATIVKSDRIPVRFTGGLADGDTQVNLPDGQYNLKNGQTTVLVTRSKADIPVSVTCNKETREGIIRTTYDPLAGVFGNIIFGGIIGIGVDAVGNKAYDPPASFNLSDLCAGQNKTAVESKPPAVEQRDPASNRRE